MCKFKEKASSFLNSYYYPILICVCMLISHTLSIEIFGIAVLVATASLGFLFCKDLKFLLSPLFMFILMFSQPSVESGVFYETPYLVAIVCFAVYLIALFIAHFVVNRSHLSVKGFIKSKLFWGYIALCGAYLLNGALNFDEYVFGNIVFALIQIVSLGFIFFIFHINLDVDKNTLKYLFYVLYLTSVLVTLQVFLSFVTGQVEFQNGEIVKESLLFGWGMWNNAGGLLAFLLPVHFYFASSCKKYGFAFYISGIISYLAIVLSLSRSSLLVSTFMIVACAIISCFLGENKKTNRIITLSIAIIGILGVIVLWDKISNILGDYLSRGFSDNGRFEIYRKGLANFADNPIFGGGFHSVKAQEHTFVKFLPDRYHNTFIQMMGACGIVGLVAYLFHRAQTVLMFWKKKAFSTLFLGICIASLLLTSMLDNHFFNIYPTFIYSVILVVIDKSDASNL